jgi:hypothetical protein
MEQVRYLKSLPEVRRVIRRLLDSLASDMTTLASTKRALNISSLIKQPIELLAAKPPRKRESVLNIGDEETPPRSSGKTKGKAAPKAAPPAPAPKAKAKSAPATKPASTPKKGVDLTKVNQGRIAIRGPNEGDDSGADPVEPLAGKAQKQVQQLSDLLNSRHDKLNHAEHIQSLLTHTFGDDDPTAIRMRKIADKLVSDSRGALEETQNTLHSLGTQYAPPQFKKRVAEVFAALKNQFEGKYKNLTQKFAVAQAEFKNESAIFFIGYIQFDDLQGTNATQDYVVVLTQVSQNNVAGGVATKGTGKVKEALAPKKGRTQNFIRTLTDYRPPSWITKHTLGVPYGDDIDRAIRSVLLTMQSEDMLDMIDRSGVPLKSTDIKFNNKMVDGARIIEDKDILRVYLDPKISSEKIAKDAMASIFVEVKQMIKAAHPRYKNPVKVFNPKYVDTRRDTPKGPVKVKRFVIDFAFSKPESGADIEMPRARIQKFMEIFDFDNDKAAREFSVQLKRFLGVH